MVTKLKEKLRNSSGFSLLEVLLAVLLLAIVVTPLIQVITTSMTLNMKAKKQQGANDVTQAVMEYLQGLTSEEIDTNLRGNGTSTVSLPFCGFTGRVARAELYSTDIYNRGFRQNNFNVFRSTCALIGYTHCAVMEDSDCEVLHSDEPGFENMYCINSIKQGDNYYDAVIRLEPLTDESNEYIVYDVYVEVHLVDFTGKTNLQYHDTYNNSCLCTAHGSVFNKLH